MFYKYKNKKRRLFSRGMSYIELIVVLSIFSIMSAVVLFDYNSFGARITIKNLANDIALKIVQAEKQSAAGNLPLPAQQQFLIDNGLANWAPSYGVSFNLGVDNKKFAYFADLLNDNVCDATCSTNNSGGDYTNTFSLAKNTRILEINLFMEGDPNPILINNLDITFTRSKPGATFAKDGAKVTGVLYAEIKILSDKSVTAVVSIKVYSSGRIQVD